MRIRPLLAPAAATILLFSSAGAITASERSCVIDVGAALAESPKIADVTPLAEGAWVDDVYVMPYSHPGPYDRELPGGIVNIEARQWVAQSFFAHNPDIYDFIVVVTDFAFDAGWGQHGDPTHGLYWGIKNDDAGIGLEFFDHSQVFGSSRLEGYIDANTLELVRGGNGLFDHQRFQTILSHELGHRWLAYAEFEDDQGSVSSDLQGVDLGHWSYLLDSDASFMYGADWLDNDDGTFTAAEVMARYSDLDLYLMGLLEAHEVPPVTLLENPTVPADQYPELGAVIQASPTNVTVDQVIAAEGPRIPSARDTDHEHRIALVYLVAPDGSADAEELQFLTAARTLWQRRHFALTNGLGVIGVGRNSLPVESPATLDLGAAVAWLLDAADAPGRWADDPVTAGRDTAAVIDALDAFGGHQTQIEAALDELAAMSGDPTETAAWRAAALARHAHPGAPALLDDLSSWVLAEGAWGGGLRYAGDPVTTARVARGLSAGGRSDEAAAAAAWLRDRQHDDGGWSWRDGGPSAVAPTLEAAAAILAADPSSWSQPVVQDAAAWLLARRTQGGVGDPSPTVQQTALLLQVLHGHSADQEIVNQAVAFLATRQRSDGSWGGSVFQTAAAVAALVPYLQPDLEVSPTELLVAPDRPFVDDPLTLTAAVRANVADIPAGVPYRWKALDTGGAVVATLDGLLPPIPATLFSTVTDTWDLRYQVSAGTYTFRFTADPDNTLAEADETNNSADIPVTFRAHTEWIDLELRPDEVHATPAVIDSIPQTLSITGIVHNNGVGAADGAVIAVFEVGSPDPLASTVVSVPITGEAAFQLPVQLDEARPHLLAVVADPDDLLGDSDPGDNRVEIEIALAATFDPAVIADSLAINPASGVAAGDPLTISFELANHGTEPLSDLQTGVAFAAGDPPATTVIGLQEISETLAPGEVRTVSLGWRPPVADPAIAITVEVDPYLLVDDADRGNNIATASLEVGPSPLPNLVADHATMSFDPEPALQNETVHITASVVNPTDNSAGPFSTRIWIDEIGTGVLAGEIAVPGLGPGESAVVEADWLVDEMTDRLVWLEVDGEDQVVEFDEGDNDDFRVLDVDAIPDLVVTSGQVTVEPRFPHTGDEVAVEITILNTGDQPAADVGVELAVVDGPVAASTVIPVIAAGSAETVVLQWSASSAPGEVALRVTADPDDTVVELDEDNNSVALRVSVQDADLWVTERYISPDGDGVLDSTTVFVRAGIDTVEVVDSMGVVVRELVVDPTGVAIWDGRATNQAVVRDGIYTLRADGLSTWVDVDLNQTTITDDIRQPLVTGLIATTSSLPNARFTSYVQSPVDGVVYLAEWLGSTDLGHTVWRWNGDGLDDIGPWPDGHGTLKDVSADGRTFITGAGGFSLIRFPGPVVDQLTPPAGGYAPHLSSDGRWILWIASSGSTLIVLQRTDDLGEIHQLGPFSAGGTVYSPTSPTVHFSPNGCRALVGLHNPGSGTAPGHGRVLDIDLGEVPSVREIPLEQSCGGIDEDLTENHVFASVDFSANRMTCPRDRTNRLYTVDLQTGATVADVSLPWNRNGTDTWYTLSNDGRAVGVLEWTIELKSTAASPSFLYDWRRGIDGPFPGGAWSSHDRYAYWLSDDHFRYRTPAANLAVVLDPVLRFGNAGIDLYLTVTDRNLDNWLLEAAPASDPEAFEPIGQPSRDTVSGTNWGTWIPPGPGAWRLRLTAVDLAGNQRSTTHWATWNGASDIAGLWTESRYLSPVSSPGLQDELVWHYTVLRPSQLRFKIVTAGGDLVRTIAEGAAQTGPRTTTWNGLDDAGMPVPDGDYALVFRGAEWPVTVDNTPPAASFEIAGNGLRPTADEIDTAATRNPPVELDRSALFNRTAWSVADDQLERVLFESRRVDQSAWGPEGAPVFSPTTEPTQREDDLPSEFWAEKVVRLVATDRAGNRSVAERLHREEQLVFAVAEPSCRSGPEPCIFPDRPAIDDIGDADGLMDAPAAVLWPDYTTLLVQSTVWGEWRDSLRLEFRVPAEGGLPPGDWQPGPLVAAQAEVWRDIAVPTGVVFQPFRTIHARALPVYWEHPGLPMRPYEIRVSADNTDGDEISSSPVLVAPKAPLVVEHLSTDAGGDHFRVQNIGAVRIDGIFLQSSTDAASWDPGAVIGSLDPGMSTLVTTGCAFLEAALGGYVAAWVRVEGADPWGAIQHSLPAAFQRAGPPAASSSTSFTIVRSGCDPGSPPPLGMMGYDPGPTRPAECTGWRCGLGWYTAGSLVDLTISVPAIDPTGAAIAGYELLVDGQVVAGAPELTPGSSGRVILDLADLTDGDHSVSERYLFAPGDQGMLAGCAQSAVLHVDRSASVSISSPTEGEVLCPDQGPAPVGWSSGADTWRASFTIDGSADGVRFNPATGEALIQVPALEPGAHTLAVELIDLAGNAACASVDFVSEGVAVPTGLAAAPPVFSPTNSSGRPTSSVVSFGTTAAADYTVEILDQGGDPVAAAGGFVELGGEVSLAWDGLDAGEPAPDGDYGITVRLDSICGALYETPAPLPVVTLDTEAPTLLVTSPSPGSWIRGALELRALVTDRHLESWQARIRSMSPTPGDWTVIATGIEPSYDPGNVLERWSTTHLAPGAYEVEVEAVDEPGNRVATVIPIEIQAPELIASFDAAPVVISPNGDGAADAVGFDFVLLHEAEVYLDFEGWITLVSGELLQPGILHTVAWDGLDPDGVPAPDGSYQFTLEAWNDDLELYEITSATVIVDREAPGVTITSPADGGLTALSLRVSGLTDDLHADSYTVAIVHPGGETTVAATGEGNWLPNEVVTLDGLPDGAYRVVVTALDLALNSTIVEHDVIIDDTMPSVRITAPGAGAVVDPTSAPLLLRGVATAANPETISWWAAPGSSPATGDFTLLAEEPHAVDGEVELTWVGPPPDDGAHTIRLVLTDRLGRSAEDRRVMIVDAAPPTVEISSPLEGAIVTEPLGITGSVSDENISHWSLEEISSGSAVRVLAAGATEADGELITWDPLPIDGPATLRLIAHDAAGHVAETSVAVEVSVMPPAPPQNPAADVTTGGDVLLSWAPGPGPSPVGYHVERNGVQVATTPAAPPAFTDPYTGDGTFSYRVIAVGPHGRESDPSDALTVLVNITPPTAIITSPGDGARIGGETSIYGTAFSVDDFAFWDLAARPTGASEWTTLDGSTAPVMGGYLASWLTLPAPWQDGEHQLRLAAEDVFGNRAEHTVSVTVDTTAPDPGPANLTASLTTLDPDGVADDVVLSWVQTPAPPDLAGFYLYRNGLLANAPGPIVGDPTPFLLQELEYVDRDVADGVWTYTVAAADTAGNVSALSDAAGPITIDTRRPHAVIASPADGESFEVSAEVVVECEDQDVVALDIEYRPLAQPDWLPIAPTFTGEPFTTVFNPPGHGDYLIRAVAADAGGPDPAPMSIQVTAADLPPEAPVQTVARTAGGDVQLTWISPPDPADDLAGYEIQRDGITITAEVLDPDTLSYVDENLPDGLYSYRVVAVDQADQHTASDPVPAAVHTPFWSWVEPVGWRDRADLSGGGAHPDGSVGIDTIASGGATATLLVEADGGGEFDLEDAPLSQSVDSFAALSTDDDGNTSRPSLLLPLVSRAPPAPVENLVASATGSDVTLAWSSAEPESAGYRISRSGATINETTSAWTFDEIEHTLDASGGVAAARALVVDGDPATGWTPGVVPSQGLPGWWSWTWPDAVEIAEIEVSWSIANPPQDYDVDLLTTAGWLWIASEAWDGQPTATIPAGLTATGVRIRIPETGFCGSNACLPELTEVALQRTQRTTDDGFSDTGLADGAYSYEVRERNVWGQWSSSRATGVVVGPEQPAPPTGVTVAPIDCGGLEVAWQAASAQPGSPAGFKVYRGDSAAGPFTHFATRPPAQPSVVDSLAPVGVERYYAVTSLVAVDGITVESPASSPASGTAVCQSPPPPVITHPTTAGLPIVVVPAQVPIQIRGTAAPGSLITLLHDDSPVATVDSSSIFLFNGVDVHPGINVFAVRQELLGGSAISAPISVELDSSLVPDVEAVGLTVTPSAAAPNQLVMIEGTVALHAAAGGAEAFDLVIEMTDPTGAVSELHRTRIALSAGETTTVRAAWTGVEPAGLYDWRMTVDPANELIELDEANNSAEARSHLLDHDGFDLRVRLERASYVVGQQLTGSVFFASSAEARDIGLEIRLEDVGGNLVSVMASNDLPAFGGEWLEIDLDHPLVGLYPGLYRVRAAASAGDELVAAAMAPFELEQPVFLEAEVSADRSTYPAGAPVEILGRVRNPGPAFVDDLSVAIAVVEETSGQHVAGIVVPGVGLAAGSAAEIPWTWRSPGAAPGPYLATMAVNGPTGTVLVAADGFPFTITPGDVRLAAEIDLSATPVEPGDPVTASVEVANNGFADLAAVNLLISVVDPIALAVTEEHSHVIDLAAGDTLLVQQILDTGELPLHRHLVLATATGDDDRGPFSVDLDSATLEVADLSPPDLVVLQPSDGGSVIGELTVAVDVTDSWSDIARVYFSLDDEPGAVPLHRTDPMVDPARWGLTMELPPGMEGPHTLTVSAEDEAGNTGEATVAFTVTEAILAIGGTIGVNPAVVEPGQLTTIAAEITNAGADLNAVEARVEVVESPGGAVAASHSATFDLATNQSGDLSFDLETAGWQLGPYEARLTVRGVFLDQSYELDLGSAGLSLADLTPPQVVVVAPPPGLACSSIEVVAEAVDNLTGVAAATVSVDGGAVVPMVDGGGGLWSATLDLVDGVHHLAVTAVDGGGNGSAPAVVEVDLDTRAPDLEVDAPADGACLDNAFTVAFTADDAHLDSVAATLNGSPIPSGHLIDIDGSFVLEVSAVDLCGRQSLDQRNFILDTIEPELAVNGVFEGGVFAVGVPGSWTADDDNLVAASAVLDGEPVDPSFTVTASGPHLLEITAEDCAGTTSELAVGFTTMAAGDGLGGSLSADPVHVEPPTPLLARGAVTNLMDTDLDDVALHVEVVDPVSGAVLDEHSVEVDLPARGQVDIEHLFSTDDLDLGAAGLRLTAHGTIYGQAYASDIAEAVFEVVDLTPPDVEVVSPSPGLECGSVEVRATVSDAVAGVESVSVFVDGEPSGQLLAHTGGDLWALELALDEGAHTLEVVAADVVGNLSPPASVGIVVDLAPPILTVSAPSDGECLPHETTITFSAEDDHLESLTAHLNGTAIPSGALVALDDTYTLSVTAVDHCGRSDGFGSSFIIDSVAPVITVTGITDGQEVKPPVLIDWVVDDLNLRNHTATLDGSVVHSPLEFDDLGAHVLAVEADDCAGNQAHTEIAFTLVDDPVADIVVLPPALHAGSSVVLLDRSTIGSDELAAWIAARTDRVAVASDPCEFLTLLRQNRHELVVLNASSAALPLSFAGCPDTPSITDIAAEISAATYRHGGVLVLGDGMTGDGCLGCVLAAASSRFGAGIVDRVEVRSTTSIIETDHDTPIFDLRPVELAGSFPLLLANEGTTPGCDGVAAVTLELTPAIWGDWEIESAASTPIALLDSESGPLADGGRLDAGRGSWVNLSAGRAGDTLSLELQSAFHGALPDWVGIEATVHTAGGDDHASVWIPVTCDLEPGQLFDRFEITALETIGHDPGHVVASSARRWGLGEALVMPWNPLSAVNTEARPLVEQALAFMLRPRERSAVAGLAIPVTVGAANTGGGDVDVRVEIEVPTDRVLETWGDPIGFDPIVWRATLTGGSSARFTVWLRPSEACRLTLPFSVSVRDGDEWVTVEAGDREIVVDEADPWTLIRELQTAITACASSTGDDAIRTTLRDVQASVERFALAVGEDDNAGEALRELSAAFAAIDNEDLPCLAGLRKRLADHAALWQARWVSTGSSP